MNVSKKLKSTLETLTIQNWRKQGKIADVVDLKEYKCYNATCIYFKEETNERRENR